MKKAFTMIELIMVIVLVGVVSSIAISKIHTTNETISAAQQLVDDIRYMQILALNNEQYGIDPSDCINTDKVCKPANAKPILSKDTTYMRKHWHLDFNNNTYSICSKRGNAMGDGQWSCKHSTQALYAKNINNENEYINEDSSDNLNKKYGVNASFETSGGYAGYEIYFDELGMHLKHTISDNLEISEPRKIKISKDKKSACVYVFEVTGMPFIGDCDKGIDWYKKNVYKI